MTKLFLLPGGLICDAANDCIGADASMYSIQASVR
jgi:hypothetical protein